MFNYTDLYFIKTHSSLNEKLAYIQLVHLTQSHEKAGLFYEEAIFSVIHMETYNFLKVNIKVHLKPNR